MMNPVTQPGEDGQRNVRIGTAERENAMDLLGRQFSEGRLQVDEFDSRSAQIAAALTWADLEPIFADLPVKPSAPPMKPSALALPTPRSDDKAVAGRTRDWRAIVMALIPLIALILTVTVPWHHIWLVWLAIPLAGALLYGKRR